MSQTEKDWLVQTSLHWIGLESSSLPAQTPGQLTRSEMQPGDRFLVIADYIQNGSLLVSSGFLCFPDLFDWLGVCHDVFARGQISSYPLVDYDWLVSFRVDKRLSQCLADQVLQHEMDIFDMLDHEAIHM